MGVLQLKIRQSCNLTVLTCMDFRLHGAHNLPKFIEQQFGDGVTYDVLTPPGACHPLLREGESERQRILDHLSLSVSLHDPETIVVIPHMNCGKYHASHSFFDPEDEIALLAKDARHSADLIVGRFPKATVRTFIANVDDRRTTALNEVPLRGAHTARTIGRSAITSSGD